MQRYFAIQKKENQFFLEESDYYHIKTVMRMKDNDLIEVIFNHILYFAHIEKKGEKINIICDEQKDSLSLNCYITLIIPVLKEQKMDFILQKATELGVSEIIPVWMERSVVKKTGKEEKKENRWRKIVKEASEQSKRYEVPIVRNIVSFDSLQDNSSVKLVCSTREKRKNIKNIMNSLTSCDKISIVIGPEGGLSLKEEEFLLEKGYQSISLGSRILRVETTPIYLLSILNYENLLE